MPAPYILYRKDMTTISLDLYPDGLRLSIYNQDNETETFNSTNSISPKEMINIFIEGIQSAIQTIPTITVGNKETFIQTTIEYNSGVKAEKYRKKAIELVKLNKPKTDIISALKELGAVGTECTRAYKAALDHISK